MRPFNIETPQHLVGEISKQFIPVVGSVMEGVELPVLKRLWMGLEHDGPGDVLGAISENVIGALESAIARAEIRDKIDNVDHVIESNGMSFASRILEWKRGESGIAFVTPDEYLCCTDTYVLLGKKTTLPAGEYLTDGERLAYMGPLADKIKNRRKINLPDAPIAEPRSWRDESSGQQFVSWQAILEGGRPYTILRQQYDVADIRNMDLMGYTRLTDGGEDMATFATVDYHRVALIAPFIVSVPEGLFDS